MIAGRRLRLTLLVTLLAAAITAGWMAGTGRSSLADLRTPLSYSGDALGVLALTKAYESGEIVPLLPKVVGSLGAPFGANWSDFPAEDFLYFVPGLLARLVGPFAAVALFGLCLQILAGISFFTAGTALGYRHSIVFAASLLFALAPYGFVRSAMHLTLAAYWHVPLILFSVLWAAGRTNTDALGWWTSRSRRALAMLTAVIAGLLNPYYLAALLWLMAFVLAVALVAKRHRDTIAAVTLLGLALAAFTIQSLDSIWMNLAYGPNAEAVYRTFEGLDVYGLRLPDLAFPYAHRSAEFQSWADATYQTVAPRGKARGEAATAYIGLIGCGALIALLVIGSIRVVARQLDKLSDWYWMALAIIGLGVVGGVNYFLGALGFVLLRATNRFSIILLAIALLWLCEMLSRTSSRTSRIAVASAIVALGMWDQIPPTGVITAPESVRARIESDARFVRALEAALPERAMVLQLPIKSYPETGPIEKMDDYEHFRPYLHSKSLRFSYGTIRGRGDADWQRELVALSAPDLVTRAMQYGFAAIYVNRKAYPDRAQALLVSLARELGAPIAANEDLVAFRVSATAGDPKLPPTTLTFRYQGFSSAEQEADHTWHWAVEKNASIIARRPYRALAGHRDANPGYEISFVLESINGGKVTVGVDGREQTSLQAGVVRRAVNVLLPQGANEWRLDLSSDRDPRLPGSGDPRRLAFRVLDLQAREAPPPRRPAS